MYDAPTLYDIAFSYRDFRHEVDCLLGWYARAQRTGHAMPRAFLELAAGPADHAIEAARRGVQAQALDLAPSMCVYAREKAAQAGVALRVIEADMIDFALEEKVDLAATMITSLAHVPTAAAMAKHLRAVAASLNPGGVYIVEQPHPGDFLVDPHRHGTRWTVERDGLVVETTWGRPGDRYDPITQTCDATVEITARSRDGRVETRTDVVHMKEWTACEMDAAILLSGAFEVTARHGDFALDAPFDASPESWRMITVLRRL